MPLDCGTCWSSFEPCIVLGSCKVTAFVDLSLHVLATSKIRVNRFWSSWEYGANEFRLNIDAIKIFCLQEQSYFFQLLH